MQKTKKVSTKTAAQMSQVLQLPIVCRCLPYTEPTHLKSHAPSPILSCPILDRGNKSHPREGAEMFDVQCAEKTRLECRCSQ